MSPQQLILKGAAGRRPSGKWNEDDYDVLAGDVVVGRIMKAIAAPVGSPWFWTLAFGYHRDRRPTHGYAATARPLWRRSRRAGVASSVRSRPGLLRAVSAQPSRQATRRFWLLARD
jgi:hypothetical protein